MGPSNDHELAIAIAVDSLTKEGNLQPTAIDVVIAGLHFTMSRTDGESW